LKKIASIATLLFAIFVLLAHDVIPHTNHTNHSVISNHQCDSGCNENHPDSENDESENEQEIPCCELANQIIIACNTEKSTIVLDAEQNNLCGLESYLIIASLPPGNDCQYLITSKLRKRKTPPFFNPLQFVIHSAGLRAPPVLS